MSDRNSRNQTYIGPRSDLIQHYNRLNHPHNNRTTTKNDVRHADDAILQNHSLFNENVDHDNEDYYSKSKTSPYTTKSNQTIISTQFSTREIPLEYLKPPYHYESYAQLTNIRTVPYELYKTEYQSQLYRNQHLINKCPPVNNCHDGKFFTVPPQVLEWRIPFPTRLTFTNISVKLMKDVELGHQSQSTGENDEHPASSKQHHIVDHYNNDLMSPTTYNRLNKTKEQHLSHNHNNTEHKMPSKGRVLSTILDNISGVIEPGQLVYIMAASGGGKTTLIQALSGQNTLTRPQNEQDTVSISSSYHTSGTDNIYEGGIYFNGALMESSEISSITGFVSQQDVFFSSLTVRETLTYAARLSSPPNMTIGEITGMVETLLLHLDLLHIAEVYVGGGRNSSLFNKFISGGERRRVSLGLELLKQCSIIFADEILSGLDATTAYSIVKLLKYFTQLGHTIILTVHCPNHAIMQECDTLILLAQGKLAYLGPHHDNKALLFFHSMGYDLPRHLSAGEFYLRVLTKYTMELYIQQYLLKYEALINNNKSTSQSQQIAGLAHITPQLITNCLVEANMTNFDPRYKSIQLIRAKLLFDLYNQQSDVGHKVRTNNSFVTHLSQITVSDMTNTYDIDQEMDYYPYNFYDYAHIDDYSDNQPNSISNNGSNDQKLLIFDATKDKFKTNRNKYTLHLSSKIQDDNTDTISSSWLDDASTEISSISNHEENNEINLKFTTIDDLFSRYESLHDKRRRQMIEQQAIIYTHYHTRQARQQREKSSTQALAASFNYTLFPQSISTYSTQLYNGGEDYNDDKHHKTHINNNLSNCNQHIPFSSNNIHKIIDDRETQRINFITDYYALHPIQPNHSITPFLKDYVPVLRECSKDRNGGSDNYRKEKYIKLVKSVAFDGDFIFDETTHNTKNYQDSATHCPNTSTPARLDKKTNKINYSNRINNISLINTSVQPWYNQFIILLSRLVKCQIRNPIQTYALLLVNIFISFFIGILYFNVGTTQSAIYNRQAAIFYITTLHTCLSISGVILSYAEERLIVYKELRKNLYSLAIQSLSRLCVDIGYQLISSFTVSIFMFSLMKLETANFAIFLKSYLIHWFSLLLLGIAQQGVALALAAIVSHPALAVSLSCLIIIPNASFSGYLVALPELSPVVRWMQYFSPQRFIYEVLVVTDLFNRTLHCSDDEYFVFDYNGTNEGLHEINTSINTKSTTPMWISVCPIENGNIILKTMGLASTNDEVNKMFIFNYLMMISLIVGYRIVAHASLRFSKYLYYRFNGKMI